MALSWKQAKSFGSAIRTAGLWASKRGGKVVGTAKGQYAIKKVAKALNKVRKEKGLAEVIKRGPKIATDISVATWLKKPPLGFEQKYAKYVKDFTKRHGADPAIHEAKGVELLSKIKWAKTKVAGIDYQGELPKFDKQGNFLGQRASGYLWKRIVGGGALAGGVAAIVHSTDKGAVSGYVEGHKGHRVEAYSKTLVAKNPAGRGGHWAAGATVKAPGRITGTGGFNVGIGHAEKAGVAHQIGGHLNLSTPLFKTGVSGEHQQAFGLKSRSRRVAAIRRATFGSEQHLGVNKKMNKSQRSKDTLYH